MCSLLVLGTACEAINSQEIPKEREDIVLTKTQQELVSCSNAFAFNWFREMSVENQQKNIFVSPLSTSMALCAMANGAKQNTLTQMQTALGYGGYNMEDINNTYKLLVPALVEVDNTVDFSVANAVWIKKGFSVGSSFTTTLQKWYDAQVETLDFNAQAVKTINDWCAQKTNNRIKEIIRELDANMRLIYTNALYFKGIWTSKFEKGDTEEGLFTNADNTAATVSYMCQTESFLYGSDDHASYVSLPYGNEAYSMVIMLPKEGISAAKLASALTPAVWENRMNSMHRREVDLQIPSFTFEFDTEQMMIPVMKRLGMEDAFSALTADFSGIAPDVFIGLLKQKTFIDVNESGTEAAAVTVIGVELTSLPPAAVPFHVNRPFLYAIREISTGAILFMGMMTSF